MSSPKSNIKTKIGTALIVCAHPDDETLGVGGTIALNVKNKGKVYVLVLAHGQFGRDISEKGIKERQKQAVKACSVLGVSGTHFLNYEDQMLDMIPLSELSRHIEDAIKRWNPDTIFTHYWGDVNQDHKKVFDATLIAARPTPFSRIKRFICFETPSSTEWGAAHQKFNPNLFINIEGVMKKKISALKYYKNEINTYPHPRSEESIISRAKNWGSSVGLKYAEAFVVMREIV